MTTERLPQIDVELVERIWNWLTKTQGHGEEPVWNQSDWFEDDFDVAELLDDLEKGYTQESEFNNTGVLEADPNYCGTACCVAGYAMLPNTDIGAWDLIYGSTFTTPDGNEIVLETEHGGWIYYGMLRIGLTDNEATALFSSENTRDIIRVLFNEALERRGEELRLK